MRAQASNPKMTVFQKNKRLRVCTHDQSTKNKYIIANTKCTMSISRGRTPIKRFQKSFLNLLWRSLLFANYVTWESVREEINTLAHCLGASFGEHHDLGLVLWTWPATTCCHSTKLLDVKQISSIGFQLTFEGGGPNMASRFGTDENFFEGGAPNMASTEVRHGWKRLGEYSTVWILCAAGPKGFLRGKRFLVRFRPHILAKNFWVSPLLPEGSISPYNSRMHCRILGFSTE